MPARTCPKCAKLGRFLPATSENAVVNYHRCDSCWHVWTVDKTKTNARLRDITITIPSKAS